MLRTFGGSLRTICSLSVSLLMLICQVPQAAWADDPETTSYPLQSLLEKNYLDLFEHASEFRISPTLIRMSRARIEEEKKKEREDLKAQQRSIKEQISQARQQLSLLNRQEATVDLERQRKEIHCRIEALEDQLRQGRLMLDRGLGIRYDNLLARLDLLETWPEEYRLAMERLDSGAARERKFGDYQDIGYRGGPFENQAADLERGHDALEELRRMGALPAELQDEEISAYVRELAEQIGRNSDLAVPLQVTVLETPEINAFALPGGFLFVNSGLIEEAGSESELAGVIAHEIAHITARHGKRLMSKVQIASIIFESAQIAALILTGGVATLAAYYALQYGFFGLGMVLNLALLGVSRDFEIEADVLATQYLWKAGFDTGGYLRFFSRMAEEKGGVRGISWFRTHPPFYARMKESYLEMLYLPVKEDPVMDSSKFQSIRDKLAKLAEAAKERPEDAPTLRRRSDCPPSAGAAESTGCSPQSRVN